MKSNPKKNGHRSFNQKFYWINLILILLFSVSMVNGQQQITVQGTVTDAQSGDPLPGVNIVVEGTTIGTTTDMDGNYSIEASSDATLVFSFVGYQETSLDVGARQKINVALEQAVTELEEVVAVGYGTQEKVNLTASVGTIDADELENRAVTSLEQALQGQEAGLQIVQTSGQPGRESISMDIRGESTFTSNPVLTIVDGVPSSLDQVNPNDIEDISVLKGPSATAIYGSRAAGGVILVTTKSGEEGVPQISYDSYIGFNEVTRLPEKVSAYDHARIFRVAELNDNPDRDRFTYTEEDLERFSSPDWKDYNRYDAAFSRALQTKHNISISGGSGTHNYYFSMGYLFEDGVVLNTDYEKYTFQFNQDVQFGNFKLDLKARFVPTERTAPSQANYPGGPPRGLGNLISRVYRWGRHVPIKTSNGEWVVTEGIEPTQIGINSKEGGQQILKGKQALGNFNLDYSITDNLKITGMYGIEWGHNRRRDYSTRMKFYNPQDPDQVGINVDQNALDIRRYSDTYQQAQMLVNYDKNNGIHNYSALAGYTQEWSLSESELVGRNGFLTDNIYAISAGSGDPDDWTTGGWRSDWALASLISRLNYSYDNKYLLEAAMRYDGSSRFVEDIRWGLFPSVSAAWRITEENFLKDNNILTYLKLRAEWGQVGNQNVGTYPFASTLSTTQYYFNETPNQGVYVSGSPNPELTWETKESFNIGLDGNIKEDLLSFTIDVFKERTSDILLTVPVPTQYGRSAPTQNAGIVENRGWELELTHRNAFSDFSYNLSFNISNTRNEVIDLKDTGPWRGGNTITEVGHPMYEWYGWETDGFFQSEEEVENHSFQNPDTSPGDIKYLENGGDPNTITSEDRVRLGRTDPRFPYGVRINLKYKNFDLSAFGQGVMAHNALIDSWVGYNFDRAYSTLFEFHKDYWTPEKRDAEFPKPRIGGVNAQFSEFWIKDAAYFRLKNIQLGYNIPQNILSRLNLNQARIYLSGENLLTITDFIGFDPEISTGRGSRMIESRYPLQKSYYIGLNINF
jgi:TonB-linked SusC/RagA family outer membrane protein